MSDTITETELTPSTEAERTEALDLYFRARETGNMELIERALEHASKVCGRHPNIINLQDEDEDDTGRKANTSAVRFVVRTLPTGELEFGKIESESGGRIEFESIDYLSGEIRKTDEIREAPASQCRTFDDIHAAYASLRALGGEELQTRLPNEIAIYRTGTLRR